MLNIIKQRKTSKILAKAPQFGSRAIAEEVLSQLVEAAAMAPFHYPAAAIHRSNAADSFPEPWRIHIVEQPMCHAVRQWLIKRGDMSKVPEMLAAAGALLQVTWCPNPAEACFAVSEERRFDPTDTNMEHIAATAAAIQNILLCATHLGLLSYWSSGGPLRHEDAFDILGIPKNQILLGAIFLSHDLTASAALRVIPGKMRDKRSDSRHWVRRVDALEETGTDQT